MRKLSILAVTLSVVAACGSEDMTGDPGGPADVAVGGKADCAGCPDVDALSPVPVDLVFDYQAPKERFEGTLFQGGTARINHHRDRFTQCEVSTTTGYLRGEDGVIVSFEANGWPLGDVVDLPADGARVELWFRGESEDGTCEEWDSKNGANFVFDLHRWAPTLIKFDADWSEIAVGTPVAGGALVIDFDPARLPRCRASMYGQDSWSIIAYVRFDTGELAEAPVTAGTGSPHRVGPTQANFLIPDDATEAEIWFKNSDAASCSAYDSNGGQNYVVGID